MDVGFIGLGIMGRPMAANLIKAGHRLYLKSGSRPVPVDLVEAGGEACDSAKIVAERSEVVILMLPDTPRGRPVRPGRGRRRASPRQTRH
jgi:2-hydroxy-3-oxopropionate reductase